MSLKMLVDDINLHRDKYSFINVLKKGDKEQFIGSLSDEEILECYNTKSIKLNKWLNLMDSIELKNNYIIYRRVYWNEEGGERNKYTNYVISMYSFTQLFFKSSIEIVLENNKMILLSSAYNIGGPHDKNFDLSDVLIY